MVGTRARTTRHVAEVNDRVRDIGPIIDNFGFIRFDRDNGKIIVDEWSVDEIDKP